MDFSDTNILVVDDEIPYRKFLSKLIEKKLKLNVIEAANPIEAFELMEKYSISLIMMDMEMPVMDGLTAIKKIRTMPKYYMTPIIACSALRSIDLIVNLGKLRINDYIAKPSDAVTILTKILKALKQDSISSFPIGHE